MFGIEAGAHAFRVTLHLVSESSDCPPALRKTVARWANNDWKRSALTTIDHEVIYTYCDDATVTAKPVTLGPRHNGLRVVRSGLGADDVVIVRGVQRARPGGKVVPQNAKLQPDGTVKQAPES